MRTADVRDLFRIFERLRIIARNQESAELAQLAEDTRDIAMRAAERDLTPST